MNKDKEIDIDNVMNRIRAMNESRLNMPAAIIKHADILNSISTKQAISRTIRSKEVRKELINSYDLTKMDSGEAAAFAIITNFDMATISLVADPESDCIIKDHYTAFDYAMKLVEK